MPRHVQLLVIDPQNDFCDLPADWCLAGSPAGPAAAPSLPVRGAHADMLRLADFIGRTRDRIDGITVTLDSHHRIDVAHPGFWQRAGGGEVAPFTPVTAAQVRSGDFAPRDAEALPRTLRYLDALEAAGRYTLMVWPVHCEIGSWGHNVHPAVQRAIGSWEASRQRAATSVFKGTNPWTEHYSAVRAEVPMDDDPATQTNQGLIDALARADLLIVGGEASSHCVKATVEHVVELLPGGRPERILLLQDCMSPVGGFEAQQTAFFDDMRRHGVQVGTVDSATLALAAVQ